MPLKFEKKKYNLPASWASYLLNADSSGLTGEDISDCDFFCVTHGVNGCATECGEPFFHHKNDANNTAGDVCQYTFLIPLD